MKIGFIVLITVAAIGGTAATAAAQDPAKIAAGKAAFTTLQCTQCHQINKVGGKLAGPLDDVGTKLKEEDIRKWLTAPAEMEAKLPKKPVMPMSTYMKTHKISDPDLAALIAYMVSLK